MIYPPSNLYSYECKYTEFKKLSTHKNSRKDLPYIERNILQFIALHYSLSASELSKHFPYSRKSMAKSNAKKYLRKLRKLDLVEQDHKRANVNNKAIKGKVPSHYKLNKYGIYNLITSNENLQFEITRNLILKYNDHMLFSFFLFPYVKQETLAKIVDSGIFDAIFTYLHGCCKQFEELLQSIDQTYNQRNGYLTSQLFVWQKIPDVHSEIESLRVFLKDKLGWNWVDMARIEKTEDRNCITISYGLRSALINIDKKRRKAILWFRGKEAYKFTIRELDPDESIVEVPVKPLEESYIEAFLISHVVRISNFIVSMIPLYGRITDYVPPILEILAQDKRFTQAFRKVKNKFDETCELFLNLDDKSLQ